MKNRSRKQALVQPKNTLATAPVIIQADINNPLVLKTDTNSYAIGATLLQEETMKEQPIKYASSLMTAAARNYTTTECKALAIVCAIQKFRSYLEEIFVISLAPTTKL